MRESGLGLVEQHNCLAPPIPGWFLIASSAFAAATFVSLSYFLSAPYLKRRGPLVT